MRCSCRRRRRRGTSTSVASRWSTRRSRSGSASRRCARTLLERLPRVPKFRWKLKEVPLHLDRAVWIEDKDFDIDKHLRRIAVPPPGGRREVGDLLGMLMGYQLDRRRPLWEMWYVDGRRRRPGGADHQVPPLPDGRRVRRRPRRAALRPRAEPGRGRRAEPADRRGRRALRAVRPRAVRPGADPDDADAAEAHPVRAAHRRAGADDPPAAQPEPDGDGRRRAVLQRHRRTAPPELVRLGRASTTSER